ncbi:hypothetical protein ZWY2020_028783 [Hordeum vulgare]|nr:hypothetical protein ZWY2020_028783 [Hordeum vulgare]
MAREQLEVLSALDTAKTQWYHFTAIVIAGMGFFTDAYDLFCISLVTKLLGRIYYYREGADAPGSLPPNVAAAVNGVAFCGTLSGQLFFGWLGDRMGRKRVYGMTLMCMVLCSIARPLLRLHPRLRHGHALLLPLLARGFGILTGGIVTLIVSAAFRAAFHAPAYEKGAVASTPPQADFVWRFILMFGAVPALLTYYWRMKMPETARYTALVAKNAKQAAADMSKVLQVEIAAEDETKDNDGAGAGEDRNSFGLFSGEFLRRHGLHLLGTATCWFLLDIAFYSQNLFQKDIFTAINWIPKAKTMSASKKCTASRALRRSSRSAARCRATGSPWPSSTGSGGSGSSSADSTSWRWSCWGWPSYLPGQAPVDVPRHLRRREAGRHRGRSFLYLAQNQDPSKVDHGYKAGIGVKNSLFILAACNFLGMAFTFCAPESNGISLEELSGENDDEALAPATHARRCPCEKSPYVRYTSICYRWYTLQAQPHKTAPW